MVSAARITTLFSIGSMISSLAVLTLGCQNGKVHDNTVNGNHMRDVINSHNMYRSMVALGQVQNQPPAQNMLKMSWDNNLAQRAQYWANQCMGLRHDGNRGNGVGQNIFIKYFGGSHSPRKVNFTEAIASWFSEHRFYRYKQLEGGDSNDPRTQTGHYTQVVWANTRRVGCGFASYYQTQNRRDEILVVCNYSPSGNFLGQYPYKSGRPNCQANGLSNSDINGLCR